MNKKILIFLAFVVGFFGIAQGSDCVDCMAKLSEISKPLVELHKDVKGPLEKMAVKTEVSSKRSYQGAYCMQFEICQDWVDVESMIDEMKKSPYPESLKEFWTTPACRAPLKNDTPVPIIFNVTIDPPRMEKFPSTIYEYFVEDNNDMETWLKIINTKTSDGYTLLDFIQYNINKREYSLTLPHIRRIVDFVCKHGGVYSKYKDSVKCP